MRDDLITTIKSGSRVSIATASSTSRHATVSVWETIVRDIAQLPHVGTSLCDVLDDVEGSQNQPAEGISLQEQIKANEQRAKIERQIAALERQMNAAKQPRRKRELFFKLQKLKSYVH